MDEMIFETIDKTGRKIRLTKKQWKHIIRRHSYMERYLEEIKKTIKDPDRIIDSYNNKAYYYKNYKYLMLPNKYILVIIKYLNGNGFIITAYLEKNIKY